MDKTKTKDESSLLIAIRTLRSILDTFLGPFLTTYFIQTSRDSLLELTEYKIILFLLFVVLTYIIGKIIKNRFRVQMYRFSIITNFLFILLIIFAKENIIHMVPIVSFMSALTSASYWLPVNLFLANKIDSSNRVKYSVNIQIITTLVGILTPLILGSVISVTSYKTTAIAALVISIISIILSFKLEKDNEVKEEKFEIIKKWNSIKKNENVKRTLYGSFFAGMSLSGGGLDTLITILIFEAFKSDFKLGLITSIVTVISMIAVKIYGAFNSRKIDNKVLFLAGIIPAVAGIVLAIYKNSITIIAFNIVYIICTTLIALINEIKHYVVIDNKDVKIEEQCEFLVIREMFLNTGKALSFILILLAVLANKDMLLNIVLVIHTIPIFVMGQLIKRIDKKQ